MRRSKSRPRISRAFAALGEQISATASKLKKIELLADYLRALAELDLPSLASAAVFLTGRAFPQTDNRTLQAGWAVIHRALVAASGKPEPQVREISRAHSDAGKTAYEVLLARHAAGAFSLAETAAFFDAAPARPRAAAKDRAAPGAPPPARRRWRRVTSCASSPATCGSA